MQLAQKVAVVTGAGSGIGRACALRFAAEGARVVVNDIDGNAAETVAKQIASAGGEASAFECDVAHASRVDALIETALQRYGGLDVLVNNAAAPVPGPLADIADEAWRTVQSVTLDGTLFGLRAALRVMRERQRGSIINVSSGAALGGEPGLGAYAAAKAAVVSLTRTAAIENAAFGIRVNCILPGAIATPPMLAWAQAMPGGVAAWSRQIPLRRLGEPDEMANVALFLASDQSSYVTGTTIVADGGVYARGSAPRFD
jgi:NAD(P)-dependent dehydrogenase (short-subunit alcohol dehydrogenase family)